MKLSFRRRNYSDAKPIRFYCDTPSPDNTLHCVDELGHLGWCINGETTWRDDAWNVDHWDSTQVDLLCAAQEASSVESEPTMSATEWVQLDSTLKPKLEPLPARREEVYWNVRRGKYLPANRPSSSPRPARHPSATEWVRLESTIKPKPKPVPARSQSRSEEVYWNSRKAVESSAKAKVKAARENGCTDAPSRIDAPSRRERSTDNNGGVGEIVLIVLLGCIPALIILALYLIGTRTDFFGINAVTFVGGVAVVGYCWHSAQRESKQGGRVYVKAHWRRHPVRKTRGRVGGRR